MADCGHAQEGYFNYNRLWTLLIDKGITKTQMHLQADISTNILAKMRKDEPIAMESLTKITTVLHCGLCLLYTSPSPRDRQKSRMPSSA